MAPAPTRRGNVSARRARRPAQPPPDRIPPARLAVILGIWVLLAGGALLIANALDDPVGAGARDEAQPAVPGRPRRPRPTTGSPAAPGTGPRSPAAQRRLRPQGTDPPGGRAAEPGRGDGPAAALRRARLGAAAPGRRHERESATSPRWRSTRRTSPPKTGSRWWRARGAARAGRRRARLQALAAQNPRSQLVAFNQGWLAIYRRRPTGAAAWKRTIALGRDTRLGTTADALLATLENGSGGRNP